MHLRFFSLFQLVHNEPKGPYYEFHGLFHITFFKKVRILRDRMRITMMTVDEFHSRAGKIQQIFASKCIHSKDLLIPGPSLRM